MKTTILMDISALINFMRNNFLRCAKCVTVLLIMAGFFSCEKQPIFEQPPDGANQMTMTTKKIGEVVLIMAGSGTMTIDWGDGTIENHTLLEWQSQFPFDPNIAKNTYRHTFSNANIRTITIIGDVVILHCQYNELLSLDVNKNTALLHLNCENNLLTSLDVSNTALEVLFCGFNQLTNLKINSTLRQLSCGPNHLTSLDASNTALTNLDARINQLTSLNVHGSTELTNLVIRDNRLTNLDVSTNTNLFQLYLVNNQLTSLDVSNNVNLWSLICDKNLLTSLDVSNNVVLRSLSVQHNYFEIDALNALFKTLHNNNVTNNTVWIHNNSGTNSVTESAVRGWTISKTPAPF